MLSVGRHPVACGVDIGSTNVKVVALTQDGEVVSRATRRTPRDVQGLSIDVLALMDGIEQMLFEVCGDAYEIQAVCAAGLGEDGVLVDRELQPITPSLTWFDPRRQGIFQALRPLLHDDDSFDTASDPTRALVGWAWSRTQLRSGDASAWIAVADLASAKWSRRPFLSDTLASRTGAWRSTERSWAADRVELTLGSMDLLPPVIPAGAIVGELASPALQSAGVVAADMVVVAGGHDHPIGGWAVNQLVPGVILDSMGTAEVAVAQCSRPWVARDDSVDRAPGIRSDGVSLLRVEELTRNVTWAMQDPAVARHMQAILVGKRAPLPLLDAGFFIPGRRGGGRPRFATEAPRDPEARAAGVLGALAKIGHDAVVAVQQSFATQCQIRLAGGWSRYPGWLKIKSAVNGFDAIPIPEPEVTAVGAALLAATAVGWFPEPGRALGGHQGLGAS